MDPGSACDSVSERPPELLLSRRGRCNRKSRVSTESLRCASVMLVHREASWNKKGIVVERYGKWSININELHFFPGLYGIIMDYHGLFHDVLHFFVICRIFGAALVLQELWAFFGFPIETGRPLT